MAPHPPQLGMPRVGRLLFALCASLVLSGRSAPVDERAQHWSVQPVRREFAPDARIDTFIRARLAAAGLSPSPEADRRTLIRRLSFDLLGLPPTPERVARFVADPAPDAWEKLVDELLASPRFGERWARHWLDIAHYADTHGFERDKLRPHAWRYRDYVIESLNADKPYDQFLREQIAGDVLAPDDPRAVIATGFLAAGPWDFVGQVETKSDQLKRAARALDLDDMLTQVMTATMAMTINCARCHDHKLDPVSQEEYFRLGAVFAGVTRGDREADPREARRLADEKTRLTRELARTRAELARLAGEALDLADMVGGGNGRGTGVKHQGIHPRTGNLTSEKLGYHRDIQANRLQRLELPGDPKDALRLVQFVFVPDGRQPVPVAYRQEVTNIPATSGHTWDLIRNGPLNAQRTTTLDGIDHAAPGHSILGLHANAGVTFDLAKIRQSGGLTALRLTGVVGFGAAASAAASRADFSVFVDQELRFQRLKLRKDEFARLDLAISASAKTLTFVATDGGDGIGSDLLFIGDARLAADVAETPLAADDEIRLKELQMRARQLEESLKSLPDPSKVFAIVSDAKPPVLRIQRRGNPEDPGPEVAPGVPAWVNHARPALGDNTTAEGRRRLALADWITHPDNPLTPRVIVNRLWHHHFGQGLVTTPSDFGLGGGTPSHPELLDYLANELLRNRWSMKHVHKLICLSATYRQRSVAADPAGLAGDAANRLCWRQNPRRLDAESVRDAVLAVSGRLNLEMGGPGFRDFKYTEAYAPIYEYVTPDRPELWRRSIYRFVVRTTPHQFLTTLDCPDPANLTPARVQTTTALQALTLGNNEFMLQQARHLAARIADGRADETAVIRRAFELCLQRPPDETELRAARRLTAAEGRFALCRMLLNANEFVYVD